MEDADDKKIYILASKKMENQGEAMWAMLFDLPHIIWSAAESKITNNNTLNKMSALEKIKFQV